MGDINVFLTVAGNGIGIGVPKTDAGIKMCLAFHGKGGCYKDCGRVRGHGALSNSESNRLYKFIDENLAVISRCT